MLQTKTRIFSVLCSGLLSASVLGGLSASAVRLPSELKSISYKEAVSCYEDYESFSDDFLTLDGKVTGTIRMQIMQDSPERKGLVLFDSASKNDTLHQLYALEPGNYTMKLGVSVTADAPVYRTVEQSFTIENADYSDEFIASWMNVDFSVKSLEDTASKEASLSAKDPAVYTDESDSSNYHTQNFVCTFYQYDGKFGDFDNNGTVDLSDALNVLQCYSAKLTSGEFSANARQLAVCDTDSNGELGLPDALTVLQYYSLKLMNQEQVWSVKDSF